ncbi:MAG: hypothetical protein HN368_04505 [Spirochaetales bacterium]|nr:hypothetical protein [Spirochaetales bacterium]
MKDIIEKSIKLILENDRSGGISSIFIGGTIKEEDRTKDSDIDFIGIVNDDFEDDDEKRINDILAQAFTESAPEAKLRVLYESEMLGGSQRGFITKLIPIRIWIKRLPLFLHVWGKKLQTLKTITPYSCAEETEIEIGIIRGYISKWRNDQQGFHYDWIPKAVLYLCSVEAEAEYGNEYTISFQKLIEQFEEMPEHIVHESLRQRKSCRESGLSDKERYVKRVEIFLAELLGRAAYWE